jgi:hypothetical protein
MEMKFLALPDSAALHKLFKYDVETGLLYRRIKTSNSVQLDRPAGCVNPKGYVVVSVGNRSFRAHRIVWAMCKGEVPPDMEIDHIDGQRGNNKLSNLRLVKHIENLKNSARRSDNTSGVRGVRRRSSAIKRPYYAIIYHKKKHIYLGSFTTMDEAARARKEAERLYGYSERHGT